MPEVQYSLWCFVYLERAGIAGTLRQALLEAQSVDTITFDPAIFPTSAPATISLTSSLPLISQGNLGIDASNAGVILDGNNIGEDFVPCLQIISDGNPVRGLQFVNFAPGAGIGLSASPKYTVTCEFFFGNEC